MNAIAAAARRPAALRRRWPASLLLMAASGAAGLVCEIVWTQQCALWLGHESAAVLAVVAAFFGGIAVGSAWLGPRIERSADPLRWYLGCEAAIGAWALVLVFVMAPAGDWLQTVAGERSSAPVQWAVAFAGSFLLLLPATAAMGATLPAIERVVGALPRPGRSIGAHYAANTFGACAGVVAAAFWLIPTIGLQRTAAAGAAIAAGCALAAAACWSRSGRRTRAATVPPAPASMRARGVLARLALTGLLGIGYEVMVVRVASQVAEDTVYTYAILLAVYLVGTAAGAAAWERSRRRRQADTADAADAADHCGEHETNRLLAWTAASCTVGAVALWVANRLHAASLDLFAHGLVGALGAEAVVALAAFALPTIAMGALFSQLCARAAAAGVGFGRAMSVNTTGAALAPLVFGVVLAPAAGAKAAVLAIAAAYLSLTSRRGWRSAAAWAPAAGVAALAALAPPLAFVDVPSGGRVVEYREGAAGAVAVVADADGVERLLINNRQQEGSSATRRVDARQALLPLLLHAAPRRALFLGLGTGVTAASAVAADASIDVDAVELLPDVVAASARFVQPVAGASGDRLHIVVADARRYVRTTPRRYDVIVADNFHPARSGSGALYTVEHFEAVRSRLAPGGLFCQWLPLHQLDLPTLRSIVASFLVAYPQGGALLASNSLVTPVLGLVGRRREDDPRFDGADVRRRLAGAGGSTPPAAFGLDDPYAVLGSFVAGPAALARFGGDAAINRDDRPVVAYRAPRLVYEDDGRAGDRLVGLLRELSVDEAPPPYTADRETAARLSAYRAARDRYVALGQHVQPSADPLAMLSQLRGPLLDILRASPQFRPASEPLQRLALELVRRGQPAGCAMVGDLAALQLSPRLHDGACDLPPAASAEPAR